MRFGGDVGLRLHFRISGLGYCSEFGGFGFRTWVLFGFCWRAAFAPIVGVYNCFWLWPSSDIENFVERLGV